jgi:O-antigen/teichoic acid export membrane protein
MNLGGFVSSYLTDIIIQGCSVFQGIALARLLGAHGRGLLGAALMWPTMSVQLGLFGITVVIARRAASSPRQSGLLANALAAGLLSSIITTVTLAASLPWALGGAGDGRLRYGYLALGIIAPSQLVLCVQSVSQGSGDFSRFNLIRGTFNPLYAAGLLVMLVIGAGSVGGVLVLMMCSWVAVLGLSLFLARSDCAAMPKVRTLSSLWLEAWPFGVTVSFYEVYQRVDQALLLHFCGASDFGRYVVALSVSSSGCIVMGSMARIGLSMAASSRQGEGFSALANMCRKAIAMWVIWALGLLATSRVLIPTIFGVDFKEAAGLSATLLLGSGSFGLMGLMNSSLQGQGRALPGLASQVVGSMAMLAVGLVLGPRLRVMAVAISYSVGQVTCMAVLTLFTLAHYKGASPLLLIPRAADIKDLVLALKATVRAAFLALV